MAVTFYMYSHIAALQKIGIREPQIDVDIEISTFPDFRQNGEGELNARYHAS